MGFPTHINTVKNLILSRSKLYNNKENKRNSPRQQQKWSKLIDYISGIGDPIFFMK